MNREEVDTILGDILNKVSRSYQLGFQDFASPHEGIAVIHEEFIELRDEVYKNHKRRDEWAMREEAVQLGAMAVKFIVSLPPYVPPYIGEGGYDG